MNLLLDTHVFLWMHDEIEKLSISASDALTSVENKLYLSTASIWEIQIKFKSGKLKLGKPIDEILDEQISVNDLEILALEREHAVNVVTLPPAHKDPFDRMLISQAMVEDMTIVTADKRLRDYDVKLLW